MAWSLRALLLTVLLAGAALALPAFESTLTLQGGIGVPATDRDEEVIHRGSGALSWDAWIARDLALGWNLYFATLQSRDPVVEAKARSGYHSAVEGADLYLKLRPVRYLALNYPEELIRRISPFVALGVGYAHHGSDILDAGSPNQNAYMTVFPQLAGGISLLTRWNVNLDLGLKYYHSNTDLIDGLARGGNDGYLIPYLGIGLNLGTQKDRDGDGIPDSRDVRPDEPEDFDGHQDEDGAPDFDNDGDGIPDSRDLAPNEPEDIDGFEDWDGKPDIDNDGDLIPDRWDLAPGTDQTVRDGIDTRENYNNFQDEDGVPEALTPAERDSDGDGIDNEFDLAPNQPEDKDGFEDGDGAPDFDNDGDGIPDIRDQAPGTDETVRKGIDTRETYNGFQDEDGIPDQVSTTPKPSDSDGDGIPDLSDRAPNQPEDLDGFEDGDGAPDPDNDADGIPDSQDLAPGTDETRDIGIDTRENYNGWEDSDGAPDTPPLAPKTNDSDGDGIPDETDLAPLEAEDLDGFRDSDGIPDPDNDNDHIPDLLDQAPGTDETVRAGIDTRENYNGYEDDDGVPDYPLDPAKPLEEARLEQDLYLHVVHFATSVYNITPEDMRFLDRVAASLKALPRIRLRVQGHTDTDGTDQINYPLSENRARVVKDYLTGKGIAPGRLETVGYGSTMPIGDNATEAGKTMNRRVDFSIIR